MSKTIIFSNGSKWFGEEPDGIEVLKEKLKKHTLDATFEPFVQTPDEIEFITPRPDLEGMHEFSGNFFNVSSAFSLYTNDENLISELTRLIHENVSSDEYLEVKKIRIKQQEEQAEAYKNGSNLFKLR